MFGPALFAAILLHFLQYPFELFLTFQYSFPTKKRPVFAVGIREMLTASDYCPSVRRLFGVISIRMLL